MTTQETMIYSRGEEVLVDFRMKWQDVSLPDLLTAWAERNRQIESNKDATKEARKNLKSALKFFHASQSRGDNKNNMSGGQEEEREKEGSRELISIFKSSFDQVVQISKFAEQSFQSVYLILANVSDPTAVAESLSAVLQLHSSSSSSAAGDAGLNIKELEHGHEQEQELVSLRLALSQARLILETEQQSKLELTHRFEETLARREHDVETLVESHERLLRQAQGQRGIVADEDAPASSTAYALESLPLQLQLEVKRGEEAQRKLTVARADVQALELKMSKAAAEALQEKSRLGERLKLASLQALQRDEQIRQQERDLLQLQEKYSSLQSSSQVDWKRLIEHVLGYRPEDLNALQLDKSTDQGAAAGAVEVERCLREHFRRLENECVGYRVREREQQQQQQQKSQPIARDTAGPEAEQNISIQSGGSETLVQALTKQRNSLQEEVTRLKMQYIQATQPQYNDTGISRRAYDPETNSHIPNYSTDQEQSGVVDADDKVHKAYSRMNVCEQMLVQGFQMGIHDFWSRHALLAYLILIHIFALCYVVHDLEPELVSELDQVVQLQGGR